MVKQEEKMRRRGGRTARRAAHINGPIIHKPALVSKVPLYDIVNEEGVEQINELAMRIVEEIGVEFRDQESLEIWQKTDAEINDTNVKIGRNTLLELIESVPTEYIHHARNPERTVVVGGRSMVISPSYGPPFIYDFKLSLIHI